MDFLGTDIDTLSVRNQVVCAFKCQKCRTSITSLNRYMYVSCQKSAHSTPKPFWDDVHVKKYFSLSLADTYLWPTQLFTTVHRKDCFVWFTELCVPVVSSISIFILYWVNYRYYTSIRI